MGYKKRKEKGKTEEKCKTNYHKVKPQFALKKRFARTDVVVVMQL